DPFVPNFPVPLFVITAQYYDLQALDGSLPAIPEPLQDRGTRLYVNYPDPSPGWHAEFSASIAPRVVPEPTTFLTLGSGLLTLAYRRRRLTKRPMIGELRGRSSR